MGAQTIDSKLLAELPSVLAGLLDVPAEDVEVRTASEPIADLLVDAAGHSFAVEAVASASLGALAAEASHLADAKRRRRSPVRLVVVPYMSEAGRRLCAEAKLSWFDLSGNAHIVTSGLRVIIEGRPNRFLRPGRPASIFAPKSARVVRWLLENADQALTQREIARATDMTEGFVSRIVARLEDERFVVRDVRGALRVRNPHILLDAWRDEYRFDRHELIVGHVAARSGDALTRFVSDTLRSAAIEHAATGLSAAWQMTHFAAFRIATFFVAAAPPRDIRERLGFREDPRGANLWLVVPNDAGVFQGAADRDGLRCVHPVQAYVDLKAHPERAPAAAQHLRETLLTWRHNG